MRYALHGVVVASDIALPLLRNDASTGSARLLIAQGQRRAFEPIDDAQVVYRLTRPDGASLWTVARSLSGLLYRIHGSADFVIDGNRIECHPLPETSTGRVEQLLIDQVIPRALHLLGRPCLHGAAVTLTSGEAVAFTGHTGAGKSTLTAMLVSRGHQLLCDDALALVVRGDRVLCPPSYPSLRVWSDSAEAVFGHDDFPSAARHRKCRVSSPTADAAPLRAFVILAPGEGSQLEVEAFSPGEALRVVAEAVHRLVPDDANASIAEFEMLTSLVAFVPIYRLSFEHDFGQLRQVASLMEAL